MYNSKKSIDINKDIMRHILTTLFAVTLVIVLLSLSCMIYADSATCWNRSGKIIYQGKVKEVIYSIENQNLLWFTDKYNNNVFIHNVDCLVKLDKIDKKDVK